MKTRSTVMWIVMAWVSLLTVISLAGCNGDESETSGTEPVDTATASMSDAGSARAPDTAAGICDQNPDEPGCGAPGTGTLCEPCALDSDCAPGAACVEDIRGNGFCSRPCGYFGESACPAETYCKQLGNGAKDFYCWPLDGVCSLDGMDCAPCRGQDDCQPGNTCVEPFGDIRFCVSSCSGDGTCAFPNMACSHLDGVEGSVCLPRIAGKPTPKCGARPLTFCEPCETAGACETGICVESENIGKICSTSCSSGDECPSGTDCVKNACVPPIAYGCQGFLACLGVQCKIDEFCHKGFCLKAP